MVNFCDINKVPNVVIYLFLLTLTFQSCSTNANKIESEVLAYQETIDSLIEGVILPIQSEIDSQIVENIKVRKDTFQLARKRIPVKKVQFLISNEYFVLDKALTKYQNHSITIEKLEEQLKESQYIVDSLMTSDLMNTYRNR